MSSNLSSLEATNAVKTEIRLKFKATPAPWGSGSGSDLVEGSLSGSPSIEFDPFISRLRFRFWLRFSFWLRLGLWLRFGFWLRLWLQVVAWWDDWRRQAGDFGDLNICGENHISKVHRKLPTPDRKPLQL